MGLWQRWSVTVAAALAVFVGCWWGLQAGVGVDAGVAVAVAGVPLTVALTVDGVWAGRARDGQADPQISAAVSRSPSEQAIGVAYGPAFGPGSDLRGARISIQGGGQAGRALRPRKLDGGGDRVVVGDIPREPTAFLNRPEQLNALLDQPPGRLVAVVFAVTGIRGVGKSQLAAACARRRLGQGWRVVAWLNAEDRGHLLAGFEQLARALGLTEEGQDSLESAERVRHWLEADGSRCLLVFDDAADADQIRRFLPAAGQAQVIVTSSRQALASLGIPVQVDVFTPQQAAGFLANRTGLADEPGAAQLARRARIPAAGAGTGRRNDQRAAPGLCDLPAAACQRPGRRLPGSHRGGPLPPRHCRSDRSDTACRRKQ